MFSVKAQFTSLSSAPDCVSSLLQIDNVKILCDCGMQETKDLEVFKPLDVSSLDLVVISHVDLAHCGALPFLIQKGLKCPVLATIPTKQLGELTVGQYLINLAEVESKLPYRLEHIHRGFQGRPDGLMVPMQYGEIYEYKGITLRPFPAGRTVGGAIWEIKKRADHIVYAVGVSHADGPLLARTALGGSVTRPTALITDASRGLKTETKSLQKFQDMVKPVLQRGGSVLVPTETMARSMELTAALQNDWLSGVPIVVAARTGIAATTFARSFVEWAKDELAREYGLRNTHPFQFPAMRVCTSTEEVLRIKGPKLVLADYPTLELGIARELFIEWCIDPNNLVILPDLARPGTLSYILSKLPLPTSLTIEVGRRVKLEGEDLKAWQRNKETEKRKAREQVRRAEELKRLQQEEMEDLEGTAGGLEGAQTLVQALQTEDGEGVLQEGASETEDSDLEEEEGSGDIDTDMEASDGGGLRVGVGASLEQKFEDEDEAMEPPKPKPTGPKRTSLFQTRFPMFPAETEQINLTDYGEEIDEAMFENPDIGEERVQALNIPPDPRMLSGGPGGEGERGGAHVVAVGAAGIRAAPTQSLRPLDVDLDLPTRLEVHPRKLLVLCRVEFLDLSGCSDGPSMEGLIQLARPERVLFALGNYTAAERLAQGLVASGVHHVQWPAPWRPLDISSGHPLLRARLAPSTSIDTIKLGEFAAGRLTATLSKVENGMEFGGRDEAQADDAAALLCRDQIRLPVIRRKLQEVGIKASRRGDSLVTPTGVHIRKSTDNSGFEVFDGDLEEFYKVRSVVYGLYKAI